MSTRDSRHPPTANDPSVLAPATGPEGLARILSTIAAPPSRHAAITNSLNRWSNYKKWVESARRGWIEEPGKLIRP